MPQTRTPIDTSDMYIPHNTLRDAFDRADDLVGDVAPGDTARAAVVGSFYDNVLRFLDAHHTGEDEMLWGRARERAPEHVALIDRLQAEHRGIASADVAAKQALAAWVADPGAENNATLRASFRDLATVLYAHLEHEESAFLPVAATAFSAEEWGALPGHTLATFSGDKVWLILGLVFEQMNDAQRALIMSHMPPPVVEMWSGPGSAAFTAFIRELRGTTERAAV